MSYTTPEKVAKLCNFDAADIQNEWINWVDAWIDKHLGTTFVEKQITELYDVEQYTRSIILVHFPVIELIEVIDNYNSTSPTTLSFDETDIYNSNVLLYKDDGVLEVNSNSLSSLVSSYFSVGQKNLKVSYKYGHLEIPVTVSMLATYVVGKIAAYPSNENFESISIDNFKVSFGNVKIKFFNEQIEELISALTEEMPFQVL